jgi:hypothetical protein
MLVVCYVFSSYANEDDHGGRRGYTAWALARWRHLVASREATYMLYHSIVIALYRLSGMVIKIAAEFDTFFYIINNNEAKKIYFSIIFMI